MARLLILLVLAFIVFALLRGFLSKKKLSVRQFFAIYFIVLIGLSLLFLGITGRLHPIFAVLGAVLPFLSNITGWVLRGAQFAALIRGLRSMGMGMPTSGPANAPGSSEISSRFLHMVLFHDTGMMDGTILEGKYRDRKLSTLETDELHELLQECRTDPDSYNLLTAYLDREHEGWQEGSGQEQGQGQPPPTGSGPMTASQAKEILGLEGNPDKNEVIHAHRRLMQKMHPDHGGSTWLAAKINQAKDILLEQMND